jgi:hypothetical protein
VLREDWLLRQVGALVQLVARLLRGKAQEDEVEAACIATLGMDLDLIERLPVPTVLSLLTTADGLDAERCLAAGIGICVRALREVEGTPRRLALGRSGRQLVAAAIAARPGLEDTFVRELMEKVG